jgi:FkbM family methyltransferase
VRRIPRDSRLHARLIDAVSPRLGCALRARFGRSREPELALLPALVPPGSTAVDVGAHRGLYAYHLSRLVGPQGRVYCIEPQRDLAAYLERALPRAAVINAALSDRAGSASLSIPIHAGHRVPGHATLEHSFDGGLDTTVALTRLDDLPLEGDIRLIKIDVEGHELAVVRGGLEVLARHRPALIMETDERNDRSRETRPSLLATLKDLGYGWMQGPVNWVFLHRDDPSAAASSIDA